MNMDEGRMMVELRPFWLLLSLVLALTGCASTPPIAQSLQSAPFYKVGSGDRLRVTVYGEETLSREYGVTGEGDISFPLIGDFPVAGQSVAQISAGLTKKLGAGYIKDPRVTVEVLNYRPFFILGEVERPGNYPYVTDLSLLQAVALAGGYTYRAQRTRVFIRRAGENEEHTYELTPKNPIWVLPGDTIRIGERYF
jgi:protein involved in polysaccharide export with SLBB domain